MDKIEGKLKRAEEKVIKVNKKYKDKTLDEIIQFKREHPSEYKKDMLIRTRYSNLLARSIGYAGGMSQYEKENN